MVTLILEDTILSRLKASVIVLFAICFISFAVLLSLGSEIYQEAPPIPSKVVTTSGKVIFTKKDIEQGELVWRSMGGHELGSVWGHGSYVAPDWTADWLHRENQAWLNILAKQQFGQLYATLANPKQAFLQQQIRDEIRQNSFNPTTKVITISNDRGLAIDEVIAHNIKLFGNDKSLDKLRQDYAMKNNTIPSREHREELNAFLFWGAWAAVTNRPNENYSYTNNWPYDPSIGNIPTSDNIVWSVLSLVVLLMGIGGLAWYQAALRHEPLPAIPSQDPLINIKPTPSQKAVGKYFITAIALFLLQIVLGGITAHYSVEGQDFYGIPLAKILPYSLTRTWHTQLAVFWIATIWLGTGLYIATSLSKHEPKYQRLGVNVLWVVLVFIVFGSMAGEWFAIQQYFNLDTSFLIGHQGMEYIDLGRAWQILLFIGLLVWLALVTAAIYPSLVKNSNDRPVILVLYSSCVAIGLFYGAGLLQGKHTNLAMAEYWRWWVVHLWVEGFFETFATSVIALMFVRLGLVRAKTANSAVVFATIIFLTGGLLGTLHHLYFAGTPTSIVAWGAIFSALEVVPLALIGFEAVESYRYLKTTPWIHNYHWAIMFFVATAFWNLVGAGILGFLINPPISLYYIQGLNTTAAHAHGSFMGVYGMLGIGLMLICLRGISSKRKLWSEKLLKYVFWTLNLGLGAMLVFSLLPVGIVQFFAVINHGYWYARSPEVIHSELVQHLVWARMPGDLLFSLGGIILALFLVKLIFQNKVADVR